MLFITNLLPYPLNNGGKIKTFNALKILSKLCDIDVICFVNDKNELQYKTALEELSLNIVCVIKKIEMHKNPVLLIAELIKSLFSFYPYVVSKFYSRLFRKEIKKLIAQKTYDIVYVDHLPLYQYVERIKALGKSKVILDQHNVENEIIKRRLDVSGNIFAKLFLPYEYKKLLAFEKRACATCDITLAITERDKTCLSALTKGKGNFRVAPFYINSEHKEYYNVNHKDKVILFLGTMSWYPNVDGLLWFYENVFKKFKLALEGYSLLIVGNKPTEALCGLHDGKNIIVTGFVPDTLPYLSQAILSIVPIRFGSGMRIKILELMSFGLPVVSTTIGCEGIGCENLKEIIIADEAEAFYNSLTMLSADVDLRKKLSDNSRAFIKNKYSYEKACQDYEGELN